MARVSRRELLRRYGGGGVVVGLTGCTGSGTDRSPAGEYTRTYEVTSASRVGVTARYFQLGEDMFRRCLRDGVDTGPAIDGYGSPIRSTTTTRHVDLMQGHGIDGVAYVLNGQSGERESLERFLGSRLIDEITVEAGYWPQWFDHHRIEGDVPERLDADMALIRDSLLSRPNAARVEGRPLLVWGKALPSIVGIPRYRAAIERHYGGYEAFLDAVRSKLSLDGTEPYLVAEMGELGYDGYWEEAARFARHFDAVQSSKAGALRSLRGRIAEEAPGEPGPVPWETVLEFVEGNHAGHRAFAEDNDLGYYPTAFPGFDRRANTCWGDDERYIPRSTDGFRRLLELAAEYSTLDRVLVATWNDWTEGSQIEPGVFRGEDYGTAYLEVVEAFQRGDDP